MFLYYQSGWTCQCMRFPTSGLSVTERCTSKTFHCHFYQAFYTGKLQNVFLRRRRLENNVV